MTKIIGKTIGYIRVSSVDQNPDRQLNEIEADKVFIDYASGKTRQRPQLEALLDFIREGDVLLIYSMDRLARNLDDLKTLIREVNMLGVKIKFIKENLTFSGDDSPMSQLLLSVMGAFSEFERDLIRERQLEGIALAKKKGLYKGRKKCLNDEMTERIKERIEKGENKSQIAREFGITRQTIYKYMRI